MNITLRKATNNDAELIYPWRNSFEVRQNCFNTEMIKKEDHLVWLEESLKNPNRYILIAESNVTPVGVLRFDIVDKNAMTDIYLNPNLLGKGFGTEILKAGNHWLKENLREVAMMRAKILHHNIQSQKAFEKAGFELNYVIYDKFL